jgi:hypothetical protein
MGAALVAEYARIKDKFGDQAAMEWLIKLPKEKWEMFMEAKRDGSKIQ